MDENLAKFIIVHIAAAVSNYCHKKKEAVDINLYDETVEDAITGLN
jgi:hypothetical protein